MKFLDFFAGIGAFRLGLERAGMTCVGACEIADFQREVYATRYGHAPLFMDVNAIVATDLPKADLWCGGWPCQGLSSAGLRRGIFQDPRSNLIWTLLDLADDAEAIGVGPTWLLLENVPGLLSGKDWECTASCADCGVVPRVSSPFDAAPGGEVVPATECRFETRGCQRMLCESCADAHSNYDCEAKPREVRNVHAGTAEDPCPACRRPLGDPAAGHVPRPWLGEVLGAMADRGWVGSWRVLDAQFFGVAQHRERVFFLARRAGAAGPSPSEVLLEPPSLRGDPRKSGEAWEAPAGTVASGSAGSGGYRNSADDAAGGRLVTSDVVGTIVSSGRGRTHAGRSEDEGHGLVIGPAPGVVPGDGFASGQTEQAPFNISPEGGQGADLVASPTDLSPTICTTYGLGSERGVRVVAFDRAQITSPDNRSRCDEGAAAPSIAASGAVHVAYSIAGGDGTKATGAHAVDVARTLDQNGGFAAGQGGTLIAGAGPDTAYALATKQRNTAHGPDTYVMPIDVRNSRRDDSGGAGSAGLGVGAAGDPAYTVTRSVQGVFHHGVRRLLPVECERLFGLPDNWTAIEGATDSKRYEALGNSVAEPVVRWVGERLMRAVEACVSAGFG